MLRSDTPFTVTGPPRAPRQMLADQSYSGHASVHDDDMAASLGLSGAPIEGPTHFSQFEPLLASMWGERWFSHGCISAHFLNMVVEGEEVQATVTSPGPASPIVRIDATKIDGTPVLTGTASIAEGDSIDHGTTALSARVAKHKANPPPQLHILDQLAVGQQGAEIDIVPAAFDHNYGAMYPFTLAQKLEAITELVSWFTPEEGSDSPWGAAVVPYEMYSVLANSGSGKSGFVTRQPSVGLFIDLEVRALGTPILVGREYRVEREIVALGESRRTESYWVSNNLIDTTTNEPAANVLLHSGVFKDSYPNYPTD